MELEQWKNSIKNGNSDEKRQAIRESELFDISDIIDDLIAVLYEDNKALQEAVIDTLIQRNGDVVVNKLLPLLSEENASVRNAAIEVLEAIGKERVDLIGAYLDSEDKDVRLFVCDIIGKFGTEKALNYLEKALSDEEVNVRNSAVMGIAKVPMEKSVSLLERVLEKEKDPWIRFSAIDALTQIGLPSCKDVLKKALHEEKNEVVIKALLDGLLKFPGKDSMEDTLFVFESLLVKKFSDMFEIMVDLGVKVEEPLDEKVLLSLAVYLRAYIRYAEDRWNAYRAANLLAKLGSLGEEIAIELLNQVREPMIVAALLECLREVGTEKAVSVLERYLAEGDDKQKEISQEALNRIKG